MYLSQVSHLFVNEMRRQLAAEESAENRAAPIGADVLFPWNRRAAAASARKPDRRSDSLRAVAVVPEPPLAAEIAASGQCDLLMIRYNAAHRGAETEIFPVTTQQQVPVVAYTGLRWGALLKSTPDDPPDFVPPPAREWYRFILANPAVAVTLMAPNGRAELDENLTLLDDWQPPTPQVMQTLRDHGDRVHQHAGRFP